MLLNDTDTKLLDLLQLSFPLTVQPYADIASRLGLSEGEVIAAIRRLKQDGIIRLIAPVFDTKCLGYKTTLAALKVSQDNMEKAAGIIQNHQGISHGYERDNDFNLWITLATTGDIKAELVNLAELTGAEQYFSMPAVKLFKLRALFIMGTDSEKKNSGNHNHMNYQQECNISPEDRMIINEIQQDLPLVSHPFAQMSARLGLGENEFILHCTSLLQRRIMRRFGAALNHHKAGFTANAMTCWIVPAEKVDTIGKKLALLPQVSHCYERETNPLWQYNIFAMIHGHIREECRKTAESISSETGITDCLMLFSTREIKKARIKYPV